MISSMINISRSSLSNVRVQRMVSLDAICAKAFKVQELPASPTPGTNELTIKSWDDNLFYHTFDGFLTPANDVTSSLHDLEISPPLSPLWNDDDLPPSYATACENWFSMTPETASELTPSYAYSESEAEYAFGHSLLFAADSNDDFIPVDNEHITMKDELRRFFPSELHEILSETISTEYDAYAELLSVTIDGTGSAERGDDSPKPPLAHQVRHLSINVAADPGANANSYYCLALWILAWAQSSCSRSVQSISVSLPGHLALLPMKALEDLKLFPTAPVMCTTPPEDIFPVLNSVTWSGSLESLPKFMPFFASPSVKALKANTELSIDDALLLLRQYSSSSLQELEITTFVERSPTLLPDYQENVEIPGDSSILCLPHLDTLTLGSCIRLKSLFDAVHLPDLRRLELHFSGANLSPDSDDHLPRHDFALLLSDMLAPTPTAALTRTSQNLQYVSVHFDCDDADDGEDKDTITPAYDADQVASLIRGRLPSAYVHVEKLTPTGGSTKTAAGIKYD